MDAIIFVTDDGSHTLYVPQIDESYHSTHGSIQESEYIFIDKAFAFHSQQDVDVLEIGFGTGLNAFLTMLEAEKLHRRVRFTSIELYPVSVEVARQLNFAEKVAPEWQQAFVQMHEAEWNKETQITPYFSLIKIKADFTQYTFTQTFDVIYFDAFSPDKQPEMWTEEIFERMYAVCNLGAVLATYCAKGYVRRAMQKAGFLVERLPGPIGKREILRATKSDGQSIANNGENGR